MAWVLQGQLGEPLEPEDLQTDMQTVINLLGRLLSGAGGQMHDGAGRTRVAVESGPAAGISVGQVSGASWNVNVMSAQSFNIPAMMLRNLIEVS